MAIFGFLTQKLPKIGPKIGSKVDPNIVVEFLIPQESVGRLKQDNRRVILILILTKCSKISTLDKMAVVWPYKTKTGPN